MAWAAPRVWKWRQKKRQKTMQRTARTNSQTLMTRLGTWQSAIPRVLILQSRLGRGGALACTRECRKHTGTCLMTSAPCLSPEITVCNYRITV